MVFSFFSSHLLITEGVRYVNFKVQKNVEVKTIIDQS